MNSTLNSAPATSPADRVPSRANSGRPRDLAHSATIGTAPMERSAACVSGGMSWMANLAAVWLRPQDRQSMTMTAAAKASSGRVT